MGHRQLRHIYCTFVCSLMGKCLEYYSKDEIGLSKYAYTNASLSLSLSVLAAILANVRDQYSRSESFWLYIKAT